MPKHLYGSQTQKAVRNFPISGIPVPPMFIRVLASVKSASAEVNADLGTLGTKHARAIVRAAEEVVQGRYDDQFPVDTFQTGSGTSTNMNVNEVIASLAGKGVHPNDHVNMGQSSNDVFPTAIHITSAVMVKEDLLPALKDFRKTLNVHAKKFAKVIKIGRTHLQEAVPVTLGQEFSGYARQMELDIERIESVMLRLIELPIGGTAVGTGLNTHRRFGKLVAGKLSKRYGLKFREAADHFETNANRSTCVELSGALKVLAIDLRKIADDIRWMAALGEISLPELQPGSSIMPGKVNPVLCESVLQVSTQVVGNDATVTQAATLSNFELNVGMPVIAHNLLQSINLLSNVTIVFHEKCIKGVEANRKQCQKNAESGLMLVTALAPEIGYDRAALIAKKAQKEGKSIREVALSEGVDKEMLDRVLDVEGMLYP